MSEIDEGTTASWLARTSRLGDAIIDDEEDEEDDDVAWLSLVSCLLSLLDDNNIPWLVGRSTYVRW